MNFSQQVANRHNEPADPWMTPSFPTIMNK